MLCQHFQGHIEQQEHLWLLTLLSWIYGWIELAVE